MKVKVDWRSWKGALLSLVLTAATLVLVERVLDAWLD
jgi:hypothetical protein